MSFLYSKRQFIFLSSVLGLGLILSISGFVVVQSRDGLSAWQPWTLLAGGLLLTGLLLAYIMAALGRTATVERLVGLRTQELSQANQRLVEEVAVRKQIETRLQGSEAGVRAILDATVDGIITMDEEGTIQSFNSAAENLFAYSAVEIIGENVKVLMAEPDKYKGNGHLGQFMGTGDQTATSIDREAEGRRQDGTTFPMDIAVNEVQLADRRLFTGIVRDISERKKLESEIDQYTESLEKAYAELQQLDELKDNFLSSVSHELRTPLTAIKGSAEILLDGEGVNEQIHEEFLTIINSECDRLTRLINDVLDLARMDAGQERWDDGRCFMPDIVATAVSSVQTLAMRKNIGVTVELDPGLPGVWCDKDKIVQVLNNLLSNAIKFTPDGGSVQVSAMEVGPIGDGGPTIEIKVSDNGVGMDPGDLEKIFLKFKQVGDFPPDVHRGTGLGLPICKEIVGHYDGKIWCESEPGKGSVFTFAIPAHQGGAAVESAADVDGFSAARSTRQKTILVVDDEANVRRLLHHELTSHGYLVLEAENGGAAIDLAREHRPDLITMDVLMPVLDGYDAIKLIKGDPATKDIPILILSIVEDQNLGIEFGANQFISKPFTVEEMLESVSRLLSGSAKKVLIADDDEVLAETLRFQLEQRGFSPSVVHNGQDVLDFIEIEPPDLVVLDLKMPEVDGFETLTEMKRKPDTAKIPVIVLSGLEKDGVKVRALSLGAVDFVPKAEGLSRLHEEIESILSN
ncbi:MAG: response regulator [Chloroflexi bacterium]|nr:response regulator [Chloroflexota bacterium]